MGELFDRVLSSDESLFLNPQFLDYDYQPKLVPFRESQQHHIATCIKPLLQRRTGRNIIIHGKPGVGKTVCLKHVLQELKDDYGNEVHTLFVNCWKKDTSFKTISEICQQVNYKWTHNKKFDELIKEAAKIINEKAAVIVLDEVDKLQDQGILYSLLEDLHRICLILITNDQNFTIKLDNRIRSRLIPDLLEFKPYNQEQIKEILKQRIEYAFVPDVFEKDSFELIVKKTYEVEDIRSGLFLLKQSGENAENKSSKKITIEHVSLAIKNLKSTNLDDNQDTLLDIIKENSGKPSTEIFKIYEEKEGKTIRTFQRKVKELKDKKKITTKEEQGDLGKQTTLNVED